MSQPIGQVVELVGPIPAVLFRQPLRLPVVIARIAVWLFRHSDDFRSQRAQQGDLFDGLRVRDNDHRAITFGLPHHGQAYPGVSCCPLHNRRARSEKPARLGVLDDPQGRPVLH